MPETVNILVDIGHPAHVHFFKNPIDLWRKAGHTVTIVTRDKEITHRLLDELSLEYFPLTKQKTGFLPMMLELIIRWWKIGTIIRNKKINITISISGISSALPARLAGRTAITCQDTEDATLSNAIAYRFSDIVLVPSAYLNKDAYPIIKEYAGFHELAYLHPDRFTPEEKNLSLFGAKKSEKYIFIRLVKWKALHDINEHGISEEHLDDIISIATENGYRTFLSSERDLPEKFKQFMIKNHLSKIFDLMAFSSGYIGESPTMAVESAILGKPSVLINSRVRRLGNMVEMQDKYGLLFNFDSFPKAKEFIINRFFTVQLAEEILKKKEKLLSEKIDVSAWLADFVIKFHEQRKAH